MNLSRSIFQFTRILSLLLGTAPTWSVIPVSVADDCAPNPTRPPGFAETLFPFLGTPVLRQESFEPRGAEDRFSERIVPLIPEPMVFDLVRPLGERKGAAEMNILALVPIGRNTSSLQTVDPLGIVHVSRNQHKIEWAPEYEVAIADGFAIEFEFPFEGDQLEALKTAAQWTIGTAIEDHYIHGLQTIVEPTVDFQNWNLALLYVGGYRFDEEWSALGMIGGRTATGPGVTQDRTEFLFNFSVFKNLNHQTTLGLESNFAESFDGNTALLLTPQLHLELTDHFIVQLGVGAGFENSHISPQGILRTIYSF